MERLLICGDRNWWRISSIATRLEERRDAIECVIEGEARGADEQARLVAEHLGIPVLKFVAHWSTEGRAAGILRNQRMLDEGKPTRVWAFHENLLESRGTLDMVRRAQKAGIPVEVFLT